MPYGIALYDQAGALIVNGDRLGRLMFVTTMNYTGGTFTDVTQSFPAFDSTRGAIFWNYTVSTSNRWNSCRVNSTSTSFPYWNNSTKQLKAQVYSGGDFVVWGFMFA